MLAHKYRRPTAEGGWAVEFGDADIVDVTDGVCDERTFADYGYGYRFFRVLRASLKLAFPEVAGTRPSLAAGSRNLDFMLPFSTVTRKMSNPRGSRCLRSWSARVCRSTIQSGQSLLKASLHAQIRIGGYRKIIKLHSRVEIQLCRNRRAMQFW